MIVCAINYTFRFISSIDVTIMNMMVYKISGYRVIIMAINNILLLIVINDGIVFIITII
jgi:hypothetical protein